MRVRIGSEKGFTLLEIMVAAGILCVTMAMMFGSLMSASTTGSINESTFAGSTRVNGILEDIQQQSYEQLLAYQPPVNFTAGLRQPTVVVRCFYTGDSSITLPTTVSAMYNNPLPNPVRVQCTLTWRDESGRTQTVHATRSIYR